MRKFVRSSVALAGLAAAVACGGGSPTGLATGGSGTVTLTISSGTTPTYSWSGGGARRLTVTQSSGGGVFWSIEALNSQTGFSPPATHGVVPNGAREMSADVQLVQGTDYRLNVTLIDGSEGTQVFRP
jgi:hypothetical protein